MQPHSANKARRGLTIKRAANKLALSLCPFSKGGCQPSLALYWLKPLRKKKFQVNNLLWLHRLLCGTEEKWQSCASLYKQRYNDLLLPTWYVNDSIYRHFWEEEKLDCMICGLGGWWLAPALIARNQVHLLVWWLGLRSCVHLVQPLVGHQQGGEHHTGPA